MEMWQELEMAINFYSNDRIRRIGCIQMSYNRLR
jgi:hypothetical protein